MAKVVRDRFESLWAAGLSGRSGPTDAELLERFRRRHDGEAFSLLVRRHARAVLAACRQVLADAADVDDVFQATFVVFFRKVGSVEAASVGSWLYAVAHRLAVRSRADACRRAQRERTAAGQRRTLSPAPDLSWREAVAVLHAELDRMPDPYRRVLLLCYLDGKSREEAAASLGWSAGAVKGRLERGRKMLADRLARRGIRPSIGPLAVLMGSSSGAGGPSPALMDLTVRAVGGCASPAVAALVQGAFPMANLARKSLVLLVAFLALTAAGYGIWQAIPSARRAPAESSARLDREPDPASELEGEWLVVEAHSAERKEPSFEVRSYQWRCTFAGNELRQAAQKDRYEQRMTFRLDTTRSPKWIDLTVQAKDGSHAEVPGIYAVENGRLRLCVSWSESGKRPKGFDSALEEGMVTWELVRLPLAKAEPADELGQVLLEWEQAKRAREEVPDRAVLRDKAASLADRCLSIADKEGPTGLAALCWAACRAPGSDAGKKALALLADGRVARASLDELSDALEGPRVDDPEVAGKMGRLVLDRVKSDLAHPRCPRLLCWVAVLTWWLDYETAPAYFTEAADLIASHFADSPDVYHFCEALARPGVTPPAWAAGFETHLRAITRKNRHRHVRAFAQYALAAVIQLGGEERQDEAVAEYRRYLDQFDGTDPVWGSEKSMRKAAERELERLGRLGLGKKAPPIDGVDLDGKPMKLSDFDGKVVLLSFWGEWCGACMKAIPHERDLVGRYKGRPFALVGVNSDPLGTDLRPTVERHRITWRSFADEQPDRRRIDADYAVRGWPSFYLLDHKGVIRGRWVGTPSWKALDAQIEKLVRAAEAERKK